jgi:superfamily II DNA/RNA helicase
MSNPRTPRGPRRPASSSKPSAPAGPQTWSFSEAPQDLATRFDAFDLPASVLAELNRQGLVAPFPIQAATLSSTLLGRDVLGRGRTGSGKTLAFSLPLVSVLSRSGRARSTKAPRALVLAPTRELATQIHRALEPFAKALGLRSTVVFGGVGQNPQVEALKNGVDVLVACPGRLEDLIKQGHADLSKVEVTVLDEADHMADLGFLPGVKRLLNATPSSGQRLLFSATLDNGIDVLVRSYLSDPLVHSVDDASAPPPKMTHHVLEVSEADKGAVVKELASGVGRSVLFTRTKHGAKKLAKALTAAGIPAVDLHGNLSQNAREKNLAAFSSGAAKVMVATDIAARGIHVDEVELVVHVDPPTEHKAYLHRSGRTARAGAEGVVVTVMTPEQKGDVASLVRLAKISPLRAVVTPDAALLRDLAGPQAAFVAPAAPAAVVVPAQRKPRAQVPAQPQGSGRGRRSGGTKPGTQPARQGAPQRAASRSSSTAPQSVPVWRSGS